MEDLRDHMIERHDIDISEAELLRWPDGEPVVFGQDVPDPEERD